MKAIPPRRTKVLCTRVSVVPRRFHQLRRLVTSRTPTSPLVSSGMVSSTHKASGGSKVNR